MRNLAKALRLAAVVLDQRGLLPADVPRELAIAVALEAAVTNARTNAARDLAESIDVARQVDARAKREFGVVTTATRGRVIKRLLGLTPDTEFN